jgi:hypothetical protein
MAEDISRISSGTLSELELKLDGVGRIRTSGLQRPRLASYQARQRPLSTFSCYMVSSEDIILSLFGQDNTSI